MEAISNRLSSARVQRMLFWLGAAVLAAGVVFFIVALGNRANDNPPEPSALQTAKGTNVYAPQEKVSENATLKQLDPDVLPVARKFIKTAVARKHLAASWRLVLPGSDLKSGFTKKSWETGNISVVPFSDPIIDETQWDVEWLGKRAVQLMVTLVPGRHSQEPKPLAFHIGLTRVGHGANRHWMVDYWGPVNNVGVPTINE